MKPLANLLQQWGVEAIASVGETVSYNPQWHQLMEGSVEAGSTVIVRYVGYRQGEKLLYRARVSPGIHSDEHEQINSLSSPFTQGE
jgi:hypothetical protein